MSHDHGAVEHPRGLWLAGLAITLHAMVLLTSCGVPRNDTVHRVDDDAVPYGLLEGSTPSAATPQQGPAPGRVPVVFWLAGQRLVPEATAESCNGRPAVLVERLLSALAAGPAEEARAEGKSTAIPPASGLGLVGLDRGVVTVDIDPETSLSAERLPVAVGQVVLTVTSVPTVQRVVLVSDGDPVQIPLPDGVLTDGPVTAGNYAELLSQRVPESGVGCSPP